MPDVPISVGPLYHHIFAGTSSDDFDRVTPHEAGATSHVAPSPVALEVPVERSISIGIHSDEPTPLDCCPPPRVIFGGPSSRHHEYVNPPLQQLHLVFILQFAFNTRDNKAFIAMPDTRTSVNDSGWTPLSMDMTLKYTKVSCGLAIANRSSRSQQLAVARRQLDVLRVLKEEGLAAVDARDKKTYAQALILAAQRGHTNNVRCLLDRGVSVNVHDSEGATALHVAATIGRSEIVELLLSAGAAVDRTDRSSWTALMLAAREGHPDVVQSLVARRANLGLQNAEGETALSIAVQCGRVTVARLLLGGRANVDSADGEGMTPLMFASRNGQLALVELLIASGASLEGRCKAGHTALHLAAGNGRLEVARELLSAGADLMARDQVKGLTPLMYAAVHGHTYIVKELLPLSFQREVDAVEIKSTKGCTALFLAASKHHTAVCELLLDVGGAAMDAAEWRGFTPLMAAAQRGFVDVVEVLLSRGATVEAVNGDGNRALEIAARNGRAAVVRLLLENGAFVDAPNRTRGYTALSTAALRGRIEVVHLLLSRGASVHTQSCIGDTPLLLAATQGRFEVVRVLLASGASPMTKNSMGETPLSRAVAGRHVEVAALLRIAAGTRSRGALNSAPVRTTPGSISNNFQCIRVSTNKTSCGSHE